jgi:hypothetical protein
MAFEVLDADANAGTGERADQAWRQRFECRALLDLAGSLRLYKSLTGQRYGSSW